MTKSFFSDKISTLNIKDKKAIKGISSLSYVFRNPTVDASRNRVQVKLLPELLPEGLGCVGADGVSPLYKTALLFGKEKVVGLCQQ